MYKRGGRRAAKLIGRFTEGLLLRLLHAFSADQHYGITNQYYQATEIREPNKGREKLDAEKRSRPLKIHLNDQIHIGVMIWIIRSQIHRDLVMKHVRDFR